MAAKPNVAVRLFWKVHPNVYRWSKGRIGGSIMGFPVLLLITTGRKSGLSRTKALMYVPHGDSYAVVASALGQPNHPAWWLNLEAEPRAELEIRGERFPVLAREAHDEEREALWRAFIAKSDAYAQYQTQTSRRIPIVVLERRAVGE